MAPVMIKKSVVSSCTESWAVHRLTDIDGTSGASDRIGLQTIMIYCENIDDINAVKRALSKTRCQE